LFPILISSAPFDFFFVNCGVPRFVPVVLCISLLKGRHKIIAAYPAAVARIGPIHSSGGGKKVQSAATLELKGRAKSSDFGLNFDRLR
jgi:hypothetical protein